MQEAGQEVREVKDGDWSRLPDIILDIIFTHLPLTDRESASRVCRHWSRALHNPNLWRIIHIYMNDETPDSLRRVLQYTKRYGHHLRDFQIVFCRRYSLELQRLLIAIIDSIHHGRAQLTRFYLENRRPVAFSYYPQSFLSQKFLSSVTRFLRAQRTLSEADIRDLFLPIYQGNRILQAIAQGNGNTLRLLMLQGLFNLELRTVFRNELYLSIFPKFQHLENVSLEYNSVSEEVISSLSQNCGGHLKSLTILCRHGVHFSDHSIGNHVWKQFKLDCPAVLVEYNIELDGYAQNLTRLKQLLPSEVPLALFHFRALEWHQRDNTPINFLAYVMTHFEKTLEELDIYFDRTIPNVAKVFLQFLDRLKKLVHLRVKAVFPDTFVAAVKSMQDHNIINLRSFEALSTTGFQTIFGESRYAMELH